VAKRAEAVLAGGEADAATGQRVRAVLKGLQFIDRLEHIRMQRATLVEGQFDNAEADREYAEAFREYGVGIENLPVETSIDRLKGRPALAIPLAAALDDWVVVRRLVQPTAAGWKRPVAVARGIDPEPLRDELRSFWEKGVLHVRLRRLAESIDIAAHHPATLVVLARSCLVYAQADAGVRLLRDAQFVYPRDFWLNYELGSALNRQQTDHEGAVRFCTAAVSIRPSAAAAHNSLGVALVRKGEAGAAIRCYRKAIELDQKWAGAYFNLGKAHRGLKEWDAANAAYRKAIEIDPKYVVAYFELGSALQDQKRWDEAIAVYRDLIKVAPKHAYSAYMDI